MRTIRVQEWSPKSHSFRAQCYGFDDISTGTNSAIDHDFDFGEQVGSVGAKLVEDIDWSWRTAISTAIDKSIGPPPD